MGMTSDQQAYARLLLADPGSSAVQSILLSDVVGGTWTISFNSQTTTPIAWNAQAGDVQNALSALSNIGLGNVQVQGIGALQPYTIYFIGTLANLAQNVVTVNSSGLIGILTGPTVTVTQIAMGGMFAFTNAQLDLLYAQAVTNFYRAIEYGYLALIADGSRWHDYVAGQSQEKLSQVYAHLREQVDYYHQQANANQQVQPVRLVGVPPRIVAVPVTSGVPATSLQYAGQRLRGPFGRGGGGWPWGWGGG